MGSDMDIKTEPFTISPELAAHIEQLCSEYHGQLDDLYQSIGLVIAGQLFGWRVMRLVSSRSNWKVATELFGDLKTVLPEYGIHAERSIGLQLTRELGDYWKVVRGLIKVPEQKRRELSTS
jgi:hypothetical protein